MLQGFPNEEQKPWKTGDVKHQPSGLLQALRERAGVQRASFKRFRSALDSHGKQRFGVSAEQARARTRHTTT